MYRRISVILMSISAFIGLMRGFRLMTHPDGDSILFPYPREVIKDTLFSNYLLLGGIIFVLVGFFSVLTILAILRRKSFFPYLLLMEGIFTSFFTITHVLYSGVNIFHLFLLPMSLAIIILGILQTPREF